MFRRFLIQIKAIYLIAFLGIVICFLWILVSSTDMKPSVFVKYVHQSGDRSLRTKDTLPATDEFYDKCADSSTKELETFFGEVKSDMNTWTFQKRIDCKKQDISDQFAFRRHRKMSIHCTNEFARVAYTETMNSSDVHTLTENSDACLRTFLQTCCGSDHRIPNVVHYVWYLQGTLTYTSFLSILSVVRFIKPCAIIFHGEIPFGRYWDAITYFYPNFIHLKRERPLSVFGKKIRIKAHSGDIMRIEALMKYGGIYLDMDTVMVKPIDNLMNYSFVTGNHSSGYYASAFLMSEPNAKFLQLWLNEYRIDYHSDQYVYSAMIAPWKLAQKEENKHLIHVEYETISRPHDMLWQKIFDNKYVTHDWSDIYGIHTFIRTYKGIIVNETTIRNMNSTFGSICRHIFYGNKELCV